jgi:DNA-binding transcriptional LysR family regulator
MQRFDLGHLEILNVLLETQSVSRASERLNVTPSAVSRSLSKIRASLGDEILTAAGRDLVLTQKGEELRAHLKRHIDELHTLLNANEGLNPKGMKREFHIRASYYLGGMIIEKIARILLKEAPLSKLILHPEGLEESGPLRQGAIDLDVGIWSATGPEMKTQELFKDRFVCVFNKKFFQKTKINLDDFCRESHLMVSRKGKTSSVVDVFLEKMGRSRNVMATISGYHEAFEAAARIKCIVTAPESFFKRSGSWYGLSACPLPITTPHLQIAQTWHPRFHADPEHRWLREKIKQTMSNI